MPIAESWQGQWDRVADLTIFVLKDPAGLVLGSGSRCSFADRVVADDGNALNKVQPSQAAGQALIGQRLRQTELLLNAQQKDGL